MSNNVNPTAALLIVGNEILSGRTQDKNLNWLALQFSALGIRFAEARVIPDVMEEVVEAVNAMRAKYTYLFTTGGIGPTHDDITTACIARAFGVPVIRHPEAQALLEGYYAPELRNEARMRMADVPQGASLIANPVSFAPGYRMENVFTLAGVPRIMQAMFDSLKHQLQPGQAYVSRSLRIWTGEGNIATLMSEVQAAFPRLDIGSYPFTQPLPEGATRFGTSVVARCTEQAEVDAAVAQLQEGILARGYDFSEE